MQRQVFFFEDIFWVKFSQMIKTKADGHSEANTPLAHFIHLFIWFSCFSSPKRNYMKTQLMATVVNYLLTLGSHCGAFHRGSRSSTNCPRLRRARYSSSSPRCRLKFLRDRFSRSASYQPLARKNLPPTSCCGSDVGRCIMPCVSFHPAVVL